MKLLWRILLINGNALQISECQPRELVAGDQLGYAQGQFELTVVKSSFALDRLQTNMSVSRLQDLAKIMHKFF